MPVGANNSIAVQRKPLMSVSCSTKRRAVLAVVLGIGCWRALLAQDAPREYDRMVDPRLMLMVSEFQAHWQRAWRDSEEYRRLRVSLEVFKARHIYGRCYPELFIDRANDKHLLGKAYGFPEPQYYLIPSARPARGWCPTWPRADKNLDVEDESAWRDGALRPSLREGVAHKRELLLVVLDSAYAADATNAWLAGQLTRFRIDARDFGGAQRVAAKCRASAWWCAGLAGLSQARASQYLLADSSFARMRRAMSDSARCTWEDARALLKPGQQPAYRKIGCAQRDSVNAQLWWLADPLFREAGNARLVEQEVRRMDITLRQAVTQDERYSFDDQRGGDAVAEVFSRYGWPSYAAWAGVANDRNESLQGLEINHPAPPSPPYTTLEYALGRVSTIPDWRAISSPFTAVASDWQLGLVDSSGAPSTAWWPQEHFLPSRRLVQLTTGQTVSVRRQSYVEVVTAVSLSNAALTGGAEDLDVMMLSTSAPSRVDSIDQQRSHSGAVVRLRGKIASVPTILAIEALSPTATVDARTRYAYSPPQPLNALIESDIAMSDIAVLSPLAPEQVATPTDALLQYLAASLIVAPNQRRITLYWESYGTLPRDSADIVLRVVRESDAGLLRRLGVAAGVVADPSQGLAIRWRDHDARGGTTTLSGPVSAQMRALALDLDALKPGRYTIDITIALRDGRTSNRQTIIELTP